MHIEFSKAAKSGMVVCPHTPSPWEANRKDLEFKAIEAAIISATGTCSINRHNLQNSGLAILVFRP